MQYALKDIARTPSLAVAPPEPVDPASLEIHAGLRSLGDLTAQALAHVRRSGVAVVRRDPGHPTPPERTSEILLTALEAAGLRAVLGPRGRIEDVRTAAGDDELRTALPFLARPPSLVFLQCLRTADGPEELALVDARAAFAALTSEDDQAAESLASVRVRFDDEHDARAVVAPMIDRDGGFLIRGGPFVLAPDRFNLAAANALDAAHERFSRLLHDPRHLVRVRLGPGDWLLLDNHRTLHARASGAAWSRKAHLDRCIR